MQPSIQISTVTPVYSGAKYLPSLVEEIDRFRKLLSNNTSDLELTESIFVIDDAIDDSAEVLHQLSEQYSWVKVITLSRNYGQHPATIAGILHASGDWIATIDEDLQHHPKDIIQLLKKAVENNADISYASSKEEVHKSVIKDFLAASFKKIVSNLVNNPFIKDFNSFRVIRGDVGRATAAICRHETYFDVALGWFTKRIVTTNIILYDDRNQSEDGKSGYSMRALVSHGKRMIMSSKLKIFRSGIFIGIAAFITSILLSIYTITSVIVKYDTIFSKGWASQIMVITFFGGLSVLLTAFVLESLSDLSLSLNGKPTYFVVDRSKDKQTLKALKQLGSDPSTEEIVYE